MITLSEVHMLQTESPMAFSFLKVIGLFLSQQIIELFCFLFKNGFCKSNKHKE